MTYSAFLKRVGLVGLTRALLSLSGIILVPILSKNLSLSDYGTWGLFQVTMGMVCMFATLALNAAVSRFLPAGTREEKREALWSTSLSVLVVSMILSAAILLARKPVGAFVGDDAVVPLLAIVIPLNCLDMMLMGFFVAVGQIRVYSLLTLLQVAGEIGLIAYLVRYGVAGAAMSLVIVRAAMLVAMGFLVMRQIGFSIPTFARLREYLHYSVPLVPMRFAAWVVQQSDRYLISYFLGPSHVGLYSPGYSLGSSVYTFAAPIEVILPPTVAKLFDEDHVETVKTYLSYCVKLFLVIAIPATFGLAILSKSLLGILSTAEIAEKGYLITPIVAITNVVMGFGVMPVQILLLKKKTKVIGLAWTLAALVNAGANLVFIPAFGIVGAAATTFISFTLVVGMNTYFGFKEFTFDIDWSFIAKSVLASTFMSVVVWFMQPDRVWEIMLAVVAGASIYFAAIYVLGGVKREELRFLKGLIRREASGQDTVDDQPDS